jgi:hypothetical protein
MLMFQIRLRNAWNDYFKGSATNYNSQTYGTRQTFSGTNVHVLNCLFRSINSGSDGGAFYCTSVTCLLVESSSFFSCKTSSNYGGAIYFSCSGGQCVLDKVCGYDCYSTNPSGNKYYQFAHIGMSDAVSYKNYVNYSSIVRCVNVNSNSHYTLGLFYGKICCPSVNFSMNKCYSRPIIYHPSTDSSSVTCSFSYSSFSDNIVTGYSCFWLYRTGAKYEMKSCNILRNTESSSGSYGIVYTSGNLNIDDSCILENTATHIFYQDSSYTITLSNCTVDKTTNNRNLVIQNTVTKSFILALNHMSTQNCDSEYDFVGTLTPNLQTPSPSKKPVICHTYGKCFCQCQVTDFVSLICVFLFNFIHLSDSIIPLY